MQVPVNQFETYADGLDHAEDLAFDSEGILWAGLRRSAALNIATEPAIVMAAFPPRRMNSLRVVVFMGSFFKAG